MIVHGLAPFLSPFGLQVIVHAVNSQVTVHFVYSQVIALRAQKFHAAWVTLSCLMLDNAIT